MLRLTDAYCGPVGGENRYEFAVMGPSVNLAARLMCSDKNPGILVDNAVRKIASSSFCFNALEPVDAKGYSEPVPIFEPLASQNRVWGKLEANFAGRKDEIRKLVEVSRGIIFAKKRAESKCIMITGLGKTAFLTQTIFEIRRDTGAGAGLVIAKHVGLECDVLSPFSTIRSLLLRIARTLKTASDDMSCLSGGTGHCFDEGSICSEDTPGDVMDGRLHEAITNICNEQNYSNGIVDLGKQYLFGNVDTAKVNNRHKYKHSVMSAVTSFITSVILRCIQDARLVLVALDDVHRVDESSWQVLQQVFEAADNLLIIGTSYAVTNHSMRVSQDFWMKLNSTYLKTGRFILMDLQKLSEEDIITMIMKTLGLRKNEVSSEILNEVFVQSGGIPRFACRILEGIKQRSYSQHPMNTSEDGSVTEIILHRIDSFDIALRGVLYVGSILGPSFTLGNLISVLNFNKDAKEADIRKEATDALKTIVKEGILFVGESPDSSQDLNNRQDDDQTKFSFYQNVWRTTIMGLILGSRKKDIHKKIALSLEGSPKQFKASSEYHSKVFSHWKATGDTAKATAAALCAGNFFDEQLGNPSESLTIYEDALEMWGWDDRCSTSIGGCSSQVLELINADELSKILTLSVARGQALNKLNKHAESVRAFESAISIKQNAKSSSQLHDRSIIFPAFVGILNAIAERHIKQDVYRRYEQNRIHQFLDETRIHGRLIHHVYALFLQMDLYGNQGELDKAIAVHSIIKKLYNPDKHSKGLGKLYGIDAGSLSFSRSAYFLMTEKKNRQALRTAMHVFKVLVPKVENNFVQFFSIVYPLVFVLKDSGYSAEAKAFFEKIVVLPFRDSVRGSHACVLTIHEPLCMLLDLSSKGKVSPARINQCLDWTLDKSRLRFGDEVNVRLARLGHSADSVSATICSLLGATMDPGPSRNRIIKLGEEIIDETIVFLRKNGLNASLKQAHTIRNSLELFSDADKYSKWVEKMIPKPKVQSATAETVEVE
jgi:tetratricopeptide (TPR) repeat protein